jgi:hypothetical protein
MYLERLSRCSPLKRTVSMMAIGLAVIGCTLSPGNAGEKPGGKIPLIYCSDLFHPPDDPDDWFDLATVFSMNEFDIRGIVLDQGQKQMQRSGRIPIEQMMALTGKKVISVYGLPNTLKSPSDKGLDQPGEFQEGVKLILDVLRKSERRVTVVAVGSLRDVCAAFNREPQLIRGKVARVYVVAGHSDGGKEYNVQLDPHAYVGLMRSGLPIYWLPCFGKEPFISKWDFRQGELLEKWSLRLQRYFAYGLMKADPAKVDAILALYKPLPDEVRKKISPVRRSMWSTPAFLHAAGRTMVKQAGRWLAVPGEDRREDNPIFRFVPANVTVDDEGTTRFQDIDLNSSKPNMCVFRFEGNYSQYNEAMKQALQGLLKGFGK